VRGVVVKCPRLLGKHDTRWMLVMRKTT
jgi:hypothetical protein